MKRYVFALFAWCLIVSACNKTPQYLVVIDGGEPRAGGYLPALPVAGDVTGTTLANTVAAINGVNIVDAGNGVMVLTDGGVLTPVKGDAGQVLTWDGGSAYFSAASSTSSVTMGGDVSGSSNSCTVSQINGSSCTNGQIVGNTGSALGCETMSGDVTITDAGVTKIGSINGSTFATGVDNSINGLRVYVTSGTPVGTTDVTDAGTLYAGPFRSNLVSLYYNSKWNTYSTAEVSLNLATVTTGTDGGTDGGTGLIAGDLYDVFEYYTGSAVALYIADYWSNSTTRQDAIGTQDGVPVLSSDHTKRLAATIKATFANKTEDSNAKRYVYNLYNQWPQSMYVGETATSWTYSTAAFQQANNNSADELQWVSGDTGSLIQATARDACSGTSLSGACYLDIGIDTLTNNSAQITGGANNYVIGDVIFLTADYKGKPGLGYHYAAWLERGNGTGTITWYGTAGISADAGYIPYFQTGIAGTIWN